MKLPDKLDILIITLSDRAFKGEYEDLSGPRVKEILSAYLDSVKWYFNIKLVLIPDEAEQLKDLLTGAMNTYNIVITTGGTGIGPRDITIEVIKPLLTKETVSYTHLTLPTNREV